MESKINNIFEIIKITFNVILIIFQLLLSIYLIIDLNRVFNNFYLLATILLIEIIAIIVSIHVIYKETIIFIKCSWIVFILIFPISGIFFYISYGGSKIKKYIYKNLSNNINDNLTHLPQNYNILEEISDLDIKNSIDLIYRFSNYPIWKNTKTKYIPIGEIMLDIMLMEINKAEKFIFLEYFILSKGKMLDKIITALIKKANVGLDIRILYDQAGSFLFLPKDFKEICSANNIKVKAFHPISSSLYNFASYRDHRKMTIIDGNCCIAGGINIGDDYINETDKYGHWKDMALLLEGDAVLSYTLMFLSLWNIDVKETYDISYYKPTLSYKNANGYVIPYSDSIINKLNPARNIYMKEIVSAKKYIYITTPYLIVDVEIITSLLIAARSGIDVKIIAPHKWDNIFIYATTKSFYKELLLEGVKIYEYKPGFMHGKTMLCDDQVSIVGSINFDYRSLKWNFECATWNYKTPAVLEHKKDFLDTLSKSIEIHADEILHTNIFMKLFRAILKLLSPLL